MLKKIISGLSIICFSAILPGVVEATSINEIEANDTFTDAQELINSYFSTGADLTTGYGSDIYMFETTPWVSITSSTPDHTNNTTNSYDYYSFTVSADTTGYFDIDYGYTGDGTSGSADTVLTLFDTDFNELAIKDDGNNLFFENDGPGSTFQNGNDPGSENSLEIDYGEYLDPSFSYTFQNEGTYYLMISTYDWYADKFGNILPISSPLALAVDDTYTLQVSLDPAPVPEPTTMLLFGTGLAGLMGSRIRRKKKA
jgi:hypothetical protein